ncbi:MAG: c-type cytochrome, partial [Planctomycetaceae bacterium]|nr:c-type cytochrome [Planctomycetaceae bacterium]
DMGMPWYRPTRVVHAVSGSEFGWRSGTGKWPTYYPDSVPPVVDIGPGSPVGATFGYGTKFPAKYQKALYILDWTFGTIYAIHTQPDGASYTATKEEFLSRTPLPLTDATVGSDGALYFTVGGRGTQSELYRVTYVGKESTAPVDAKNEKFADLRQLRKQLEALHHPGKVSDEEIRLIWTSLEHKDRFIRYAARVALEHRPVDSWRQRVMDHASEADQAPWTVITSAIALARQGDGNDKDLLMHALGRLNFGDLSQEQQLSLLRAYALTFIRIGEPTPATASALAKRLDEFYPAKSPELNRELCQVLVYLKSPTVIDKTLKLLAQKSQLKPADIPELLKRSDRYGGTIAKMLANQPDRQKIHYAFTLRNMKYGWTLEQRRAYLKLLDEQREKSGGASFQGFIDNMRKDFLENASDAERLALKSTIAETQPKPQSLPKAIGPGKDWTLDEVLAFTKNGLSGRNFEAGKRAFGASRCVLCHRFGGEGGATGPDLTNIAGRFSFKDLTESIVEPSKVISDQYRASKIQTTGGLIITGRIVNEADGVITVVTDPEDATKVKELKESDIDAVVPSQVSLMPKDLLKPLNKEEILDLLAYLQSRGNPNDPMFRQATETGGQ